MKYIILGLVLMALNACTSTPINSNRVSIQKQYPNEVKSLKNGLSIYFQPKSTDIEAEYKPALSVASQLLKDNKILFFTLKVIQTVLVLWLQIIKFL
jgi:outer membrane protein OmpA-like peptidoglycan-associated protein